jgi:ABC-type transport system involved in cytochrome c biogenesis ATPase subunit
VTYSAAAQIESALKSVSPASQAVIERLSHLDSLPVGDLRYFAGDVANGAAVELDDLSWQTIRVPEGSAFVVVGANGAGKTTMIKILMNLLEATSGTAKIFGVDSRKLCPKELAQIGYVSENQELPGKLTVEEYLNYLRPFYSEWDKHLEAETLRQFRLPGVVIP